MTDDQQPAVEPATGENVMGKVLGTFHGLVEKGGEVTGTLSEKATSAASGVGTVISDNFNAAITFTKRLFGG